MIRITSAGFLLVWTMPLFIPFIQCAKGPASRNRSVRQVTCRDGLDYLHAGICCANCPAGSYVKEPCRQAFERGVCEQCNFGSFTEHDNGLFKCLECSACRSDQDLVEQCNSTSNTQCQCKKGFYCLPDQVCEVCKTCSRCKEDEETLESCTPTSNTVCVKRSSRVAVAVVCIVLSLVGLVVLVSVLYWRISKKSKERASVGLSWLRSLMVCAVSDSNSLETGQNGVSDVCLDRPPPFYIPIQPSLVGAKASASSVEAPKEEEDRGLGESLPSTPASPQNSPSVCVDHRLWRATAHALTSHPSPCSLLPFHATPQRSRSSETPKRLVPVNGEESLKKSFYLFEEIDIHYLNRFFRHIGLGDNAIKNAESLSPEDKLYELLKIWMEKEGLKADFNTLIEALVFLGQKFSAEVIIAKAVSNGYFKYESN